MGHRPPLLRLLAALILALGLMGSIVTPSLAQDDGTPVAEETTTDEVGSADVEEPSGEEPPAEDEQSGDEEVVEPAADGFGTLQVLYYLCEGGDGFGFLPGNSNEGFPNTPVDECTPATSDLSPERTFYVYPFGDTTADPIEVTTDATGITQEESLPVTDGTPHLITNQLIEEPEAVEEVEEAAEEVPEQATFEIVQDQMTGVTAFQFQTGTVELHAFVCQGNPEESRINTLPPGDPYDPTLYENCATADKAFTITPFADDVTFGTIPVTTVDGEASFDTFPTTTLASGSHLIVEDGTEYNGLFDVDAGVNTVIVAVTYQQAVGSLTLMKAVCVGDGETEWFVNELPDDWEELGPTCDLAEESFSIYLFGDMESEPIAATTDGETGMVELDALQASNGANHVIVEDSTGSETSFEIIADTPTVILVINYEPPVSEDEGTLEIDNLACTGLVETDMIVGSPGDNGASIPGNCTSDVAHFIIYPFGDTNLEPTQIDVNGFETVQLPPSDGTPHLIIGVDDSGVEVVRRTFEIEGDLFTPIQVKHPTYGSVTIYSFLCEGTPNSTFDVYDPGQAVNLPSDCDFLDRDFKITLFSGDSFTRSTDGDGIVGIGNIPATNNIPHTVAKTTGVSDTFYVDPNTDTVIVSISWTEDGGVAGNDDSNDSENVNEVADTGTGPMTPASDSTLLFGLLSIAALIGAAFATRRRIA